MSLARLLVFALLLPRAAGLSASTMAAVQATVKPWALESEELATLCCTAADARAGDCDGGLLWLEHINIVVGDRATAERFYFEDGLGCMRDPRKPGGASSPAGTMWANLGSQQFHLAEQGPGDPAQAVRGSVGLALPDARGAAKRLSKLSLDGVRLEVHSPDAFTVRCPWGNVFHCYDVDVYRGGVSAPGPFAGRETKMRAVHAGEAWDVGGRFTVRGGPGIRYVHFKCTDAPKVAERYSGLFGGGPARALGGTLAGAEARCVAAGVGPVHFVFETGASDAAAEARQSGVHVCIYVDAFAQRYAALKEFVFTNPRFVKLDTCDTLQEALDSRTFRFCFPEAPTLEHETRSLSHMNYMQPITYKRAEQMP
ncbi:hypothetical protein M885DRAFT_523966 [Pelagophyceae sp. CCMP2097]|nr:hypothetical protein M885DRAFT_523966 [Pelagophyceae sp. CCMP2097]